MDMEHRKIHPRYVLIGWQAGALRSKGKVGRVVLDLMEPIYRSCPVRAWMRSAYLRGERIDRIEQTNVARWRPSRLAEGV